MQYILNADDFGRTATANKAIVECFANGTVTRTTIMVTAPCYEEAKELAKENSFWDKVGLHLNIVSGYPLTEDIKKCKNFTNEEGRFNGLIFKKKRMSIFLTRKERKAVGKEIEAQILKYLKDGFTLLHADSHGHTHVILPLSKIVAKCLKKYNFKSVRRPRNLQIQEFFLKAYKRLVYEKYRKIETTNYFGAMDDVIKIKDILDSKEGICEIMLHPNYYEGIFGYGETFDRGIFEVLDRK